MKKVTAKEKKEKAVSLLIIEDHQLVREGLKALLQMESEQALFRIDEAASGKEGLQMIRRKDYHIVLLDYRLADGNGADLAREMKLYRPSLKVLAMSAYDERYIVEQMLEAGAKGFMLKDIDRSQLRQAIGRLLENKSYYSLDVAAMLLEEPAAKEVSSPACKGPNLSRREKEVLRLIAEEKTNEEIAALLFLSKRTIDSHRQHLLEKLGARNTAGLLKAAYLMELFE